MTKYQPIGCAFYDLIELYAIKRKKVKINYIDSGQNEKIVTAIIADTLTSKEGEFILLKLDDLSQKHNKIRMDHIVSIDDHIANNHNSCNI